MRGDAQYPHQLPGPGMELARVALVEKRRLPSAPDIQPGIQGVLWSRTWRGKASMYLFIG